MDKPVDPHQALRLRILELSEASELRPTLETGLYQSGFQTVDESLEQTRATQLVCAYRQKIANLLNGSLDAVAIQQLRSDSENFVAQAFMFSWVDTEAMRRYRASMDAVEVAVLMEEALNG